MARVPVTASKRKGAASVPPPAERRASRKSVTKIADRFSVFRPVRQVLNRVRYVPTCLVQFDWATGGGGFPLDRFSLLHGPSNEGKTIFALAMVKSFLERGHYAGHIDAEFTTPIDWVEMIIGKELVDCGRFFALRPDSYEQVREGCFEFVDGVEASRKKGEETSAILVPDSLKALIPGDLLKKMQDDFARYGFDGMSGRAGQYKAHVDTAWSHALTPKLAKTGTAMLAIGREKEDRDSRDGFKLTGAEAWFYNASLVIRTSRAGYVYARPRAGADAPREPAIGERIKIAIRKTKIAGKEDREAVGYMHVSYGTVDGAPEGLDRSRDVLDLARRFGIVEVSGSWLNYEGASLGQGEMAAVLELNRNAALLGAIEKDVRARFSDNAIEYESKSNEEE